MTTIYLIRHAEAEGNLYRIAQGQDNSNLTDRGWRQVRALERRFQDVHIDAVYSSDLYRTCATASSIYKPKGLPLHRLKVLREICIGNWEQRTWGDIYRNWPEQVDYFSHDPIRWQAEGAERPEEVVARVLPAVKALAAKHDGQTIALFSHGYAIRLLLAVLQGYPMERWGESPTGDNAAVSCLEAEGDTLRVVFRDDNSHLKTPEYLEGEKVIKRSSAMEPGLYFEPLNLPEQAEVFLSLVEELWADSGRGELFDAERLLRDAAERRTLVGYRAGKIVGLVQFGPWQGSVTLLGIQSSFRKKGFGAQLIGQAVQYWRPQGVERLRISLPEVSVNSGFLGDYGFARAGTEENGYWLFEKNIGFAPEFLGESED